MSMMLRYYRSVHVLVLLGVVAYSVAEENLVYAMIALPVIIAAYLIVGGPGGRPLPRWIINLALLGATVAMAMQWTEPLGNTVSVLCSYLVWLQLVKLFEPRTPRDQSQIIVLSLMLAVGACLTSVTPELGAVLVLYVPALLVTVMLYQVYAAHARASAPAAALSATSDTAPARAGIAPMLVRWTIGTGAAPEHQRLSRLLHAGHRARSDLNRCAWLAALIVLMLAPLIYIFMPRGVGASFFGQWQPANTPAVTGFRDHVQLGSQGLISESQRMVMTVRVDVPGQREDGLGKPYRLRGAVLDRYDPSIGLWRRSEFVASTDRRRNVNPTEARPLPPSNPRVPLICVHITPIDQPVGSLFSVWRPLWARWESGRRGENYQYNSFDGQMDVPIRTSGTGYTVVCAPGEPAPSGPQAILALRELEPLSGEFQWVEEASAGRSMPEPPPPQFHEGPIHDLAAKLLSEARIDLQSEEWDTRRRAVSHFLRHLQTRYTYTTQMTAPTPGRDPIESFLFDPERGGRGHCEYFAAALAAMSLSVGVPARVVTGYICSEYDPISGEYSVRENHAHAWVEAEVRPGLWEEFDPSPSSDISRLHHPSGALASIVRSMIDAMQFAWIEGVVTFDSNRQSGVLQGFASKPLEAIRALNQRIAAMLANEEALAQDSRTVFWTRLAGWSVLLAIALMLAVHLLVSRIVRLVRRLRSGRPALAAIIADPAMERLQGYADRLQRALAKAGAPRPEHCPTRTHLDSLDERLALLAAPARSLIDLYYRARFARDRLDRAELHLAGELIGRVEAEASRLAAAASRRK